jgi:outer membrane protein assembly factor BamB
MAGNIYTVGSFGQRADFDAGAGIFYLTSSSRSNFLCKYSADGRFMWAKKTDMAINSIDYANGHIYIGGTFTGRQDMDFGADSLIVTTDSLNYDLYISKLDTAANLVWNRVIIGTGYDALTSLSADPNGNIYINCVSTLGAIK